MPRAKKQQPELEPEEDEEVALPVPSGKRKLSSGAGEKRAKKSKKAAPPPDPVSEDEEEEAYEQEKGDYEQEEEFAGEADEEQQVAQQPAEEEEEEEEEDPNAARKKKMMRNRKARLVGYRNLAKAAGYLDKYPDDVVGSAGLDGQACLLSLADAKRCTRFVPATPGATTYGLDEFSKRHELFKKSMPDGAARESQVNLDLVLRSALNDATVRAMEAGKKTISASMMQSVLRGPAQNMLFTSVVPPVGLVRFGQAKGLLHSSEIDASKKAEEKAEASKAKKMATDHEKAEEKRLAAARACRELKREAAARAAVAAA
tara:strand:+ start:3773 stop:4720 length:948 start_codon:yes stop_codon:yes gene_type:complete